MKKILTICGVLYGLSILVSGLATNVFVFIISQGIMGALSMYGIFIATLSLINVPYPDRKGLVMGVLYGSQAAGGALMAPACELFHRNIQCEYGAYTSGNYLYSYNVCMLPACIRSY